MGEMLEARSAALGAQLSKALALATGANAKQASAFAVGSSGRALPYQVTIVPLREDSVLVTDWQRPLALVSLSNPASSASLGAGQLRSLFGLSAAEARLVRTLAGGESLAQYAEHAGVTMNTARSQLKAALAKTGTHRQSELVKLVDALPRLRQ
jgi:DNA-binding CsgD family transcriptional regulator